MNAGTMLKNAQKCYRRFEMDFIAAVEVEVAVAVATTMMSTAILINITP
jgi:hypothetical protein